jgi:hypothetical protein
MAAVWKVAVPVTVGDQTLSGANAVRMADALGMRVGARLELRALETRVVASVPATGDSKGVSLMRARLTAYLELSAYLDGQGLHRSVRPEARKPGPGALTKEVT